MDILIVVYPGYSPKIGYLRRILQFLHPSTWPQTYKVIPPECDRKAQIKETKRNQLKPQIYSRFEDLSEKVCNFSLWIYTLEQTNVTFPWEPELLVINKAIAMLGSYRFRWLISSGHRQNLCHTNYTLFMYVICIYIYLVVCNFKSYFF